MLPVLKYMNFWVRETDVRMRKYPTTICQVSTLLRSVDLGGGMKLVYAHRRTAHLSPGDGHNQARKRTC